MQKNLRWLLALIFVLAISWLSWLCWRQHKYADGYAQINAGDSMDRVYALLGPPDFMADGYGNTVSKRSNKLNRVFCFYRSPFYELTHSVWSYEFDENYKCLAKRKDNMDLTPLPHRK